MYLMKNRITVLLLAIGLIWGFAGAAAYAATERPGVIVEPLEERSGVIVEPLEEQLDATIVPLEEQPSVTIVPFNVQRATGEPFVLDIVAGAAANLKSVRFTMTADAGVVFREAVFANAAPDGSYVDYNRANRQLTVNLAGTGNDGKLIASLIYAPVAKTEYMRYTVQGAGMSIVFDPPADVSLPTAEQTIASERPAIWIEMINYAPKAGEPITVFSNAPGAAFYVFDELNNRMPVGIADAGGKVEFRLEAGLYKMIVVAEGMNSLFVPLTVYTTAGEAPDSLLTPNVNIPKQVALNGWRLAKGVAVDFDHNGQNDGWPTYKYEIYRFDNATEGGELTAAAQVGTVMAGAALAARNDDDANNPAFASVTGTTAAAYGWYNIHNPYTFVVVPVDRRGVSGPASEFVIDNEFSDTWRDAGLFAKSVNEKRENRAQWFETVSRWPNGGKNEANAKRDLIAFLDASAAMGSNVIYFQVKGNSDALWPSNVMPWSTLIADVQGSDPGWDPLAFMIEECHKRNMECHAWFNPYRLAARNNNQVGGPNNVNTANPNIPRYVAWEHPEWLATAANTIIDPGIPAARRWVEDGIMEVVRNYDIDGIHFDDYFY